MSYRPQRQGTRQPRHQELQNLVGTLGRVRSGTRKKDGAPVYGVSCVACEGLDGQTFRAGKPNDFTDALYRWTNHLRAVHRDVKADCLRYKNEAHEYAAKPKRDRQWEEMVRRLSENA